MARIVIESGGLHLEIEPGVGAGIADLSVRGPRGEWWPLMRRAPERVGWFNDLASYFLAPWPNRIAGARFEHRGRRHDLKPDWPDGSAIHGLVKDRPWRVVERSPVSAALGIDSDEIGAAWPWAFRASAAYELFDEALSLRLSVRNLSREPMPAGLGFHPFFNRALWDRNDRVEVRYSASGRYPATEMFPTGPARDDDVAASLREGRPLGHGLDDVFLGSADGAHIHWPASGVRARFACSPNLSHAVIYTGGAVHRDLPFFCFEPVTMVNDGFNLMTRGWEGTGVSELGPGEELGAEWTLTFERL